MPGFLTDDQKVLSRDGALIGTPTGRQHTCTLSGCRGVRITVRWPDGRISYPCSKGLVPDGKNVRIA